jgi:hypothetical protein
MRSTSVGCVCVRDLVDTPLCSGASAATKHPAKLF